MFTEPQFEVTVSIPKQYQNDFVHPVTSNVTDPNIDLQFVPTEISSNFNDYRLLVECEEFEMYPQSNKVFVQGDKFVFNRDFDPSPILMIVDSQENLSIKNLQVNSSNNQPILERSNIQNITLSSPWMALDSDSIHSAYLFTEKIQSVGSNVNLRGLTDFELRLPKNNFEMILEVPEKTNLFIDGELIKLTENSKLKIEFSSTREKSLFFKRDLDVSTFPTMLSTLRIAEPVNLLLDRCVGTLSIANLPATYEMHGSGSIYIETVYADLSMDFKKGIQVDSSGNAEKILINGMEPWLYQIFYEFFRNSIGITVGIIGVLTPMFVLILKFKKVRFKKNPQTDAGIDSAWKDFQWVFWPLMVILVVSFTIASWNEPDTLSSKIANVTSVLALFFSVYIAVWALGVELRRRNHVRDENKYYKINVNDKLSALVLGFNITSEWQKSWSIDIIKRQQLCTKISNNFKQHRGLIIEICNELQILNLNPHIPANIKDQVYLIMVQARKAVEGISSTNVSGYYIVINDVFTRIQNLFESEYMKEIETLREEFGNDRLVNLD